MAELRGWQVLLVGYLLEVGVGALSLVYSFATVESAAGVVGLLVFGVGLVVAVLVGVGLLSLPPVLMLWFDRWPRVAAGWCVLLAAVLVVVALRASWNVVYPLFVFYPPVLLVAAGVAVRNASVGR